MDTEREYARKLLERNRVGAILRVTTYRPETVEMHAQSAMEAVRKLVAIKLGERPAFNRIDLLVSADPDFEDTDCGLTAPRLRKLVQAEFADSPVHVLEVKKGDIYCMLLNYGIATQLEDRISYSLILSHSASEYVTEETIVSLLSAMYQKARAAGVVIGKVATTVRMGYLTNAFAMWHNKSLMTVGGFDMLAAKPPLSLAHLKEKVSGHSVAKMQATGDGRAEYYLAGSEETIPLVRMVRSFGKCIRVIEPTNPDAKWKEPNLQTDPREYYRYHAIIATKEQRVKYMAGTQGVGLEYIQRGVMSDTGREDVEPTI